MPPDLAGIDPDRTHLFEYRARRTDGTQAEGRITAADELELDRLLAREGLTLVDAQRSKEADAARTLTMPQRDLVGFSNQLATMIQAGVPLLQSLQHLAQHTRSKACRAIVNSILRRIEGGSSLSEALACHPRAFPTTYIAMVQSGEISTALPDVLRRQGEYLEWLRDVRSSTKQALVYPAALCVAVIGLIVILLTFLIPRLIGLFPGGPEDLPEQTRIVLGISAFLKAHWQGLTALVLLSVGLHWGMLRVPRTRLFLSHALLRTPRVGHLVNMLAVARFSTTAAALHQSGCDILRTLEIAGGACGNAYLEHGFARVLEEVRGGSTIHEAMEAVGGFDPYLVQLTAVGESSGRLGECLEQVAASYNAEVPRIVKWVLGLIEPTVIVGGGVVVGFLLLAAILPIFAIYETL